MIKGTRWQPIGKQFEWACRVCVNSETLTCVDCRNEECPGFEFDPHMYIKMCRELTEDKYYYDGEKLHRITAGNRFAEMEEKLKRTEEDRDYWRRIAEKALQEVVNMAYKLVDSKIKR